MIIFFCISRVPIVQRLLAYKALLKRGSILILQSFEIKIQKSIVLGNGRCDACPMSYPLLKQPLKRRCGQKWFTWKNL
ncbi:unnamed protein product [Citrullus colocynthis]|uniref:Uncharacterized protein n=1 Tax=Citrullus colocynthis TaxID=252529 RepID=A0ABP0Z477_9ROSI